jgi:hypothetical protein
MKGKTSLSQTVGQLEMYLEMLSFGTMRVELRKMCHLETLDADAGREKG